MRTLNLAAVLVLVLATVARGEDKSAKPTRHVPNDFPKLIPEDLRPKGIGKKWSDIGKARKAIEGKVGELVAVAVPLERYATDDDTAEPRMRSDLALTALGLKVRFECRMREPTKTPRKAAGFTGKVKHLYLSQGDVDEPPVMVVILEDCEPSK